MNTDAPNGRRGCKSAVIVVAILLFIGSIPILLFIGQMVRWKSQVNATRHMLLTDIDHLKVRDAGRTLLSQHVREGPISGSQLPPLFNQLGVRSADIGEGGRLWLEFGGGFHHHGLLIVPQSDKNAVRDNEHVSHTLLVDGMWYYEDKN